jgi:predicted nucleic acid-binding protein
LPKSFAAKNVIADSSALVALLSSDDEHHTWIDGHLDSLPWPWITCDAALSEAFYLVGDRGIPHLIALLRRAALKPVFNLSDETKPVLALIEKYRNVPMSLADACLVRMSETMADPIVLTTDSDFRIYRRHSRHVIPCLMP